MAAQDGWPSARFGGRTEPGLQAGSPAASAPDLHEPHPHTRPAPQRCMVAFQLSEALVMAAVINVNSVPLVIFLVVEAASWVFLLVRMLIVRPKLSLGRAAVGVIVGAALIQALGLARGLPDRTVALMGITAALSFAVSTLVLRGHYARYFEAQEEHGVRSVESRKASNPVAFGIIGLVAVFAAIFLVVCKAVTL
jgi:hypothetical protein